jgi:hypothetical protein
MKKTVKEAFKRFSKIKNNAEDKAKRMRKMQQYKKSELAFQTQRMLLCFIWAN